MSTWLSLHCTYLAGWSPIGSSALTPCRSRLSARSTWPYWAATCRQTRIWYLQDKLWINRLQVWECIFFHSVVWNNPNKWSNTGTYIALCNIASATSGLHQTEWPGHVHCPYVQIIHWFSLMKSNGSGCNITKLQCKIQHFYCLFGLIVYKHVLQCCHLSEPWYRIESWWP